MLTLREAKASRRIKNVAGVCHDSTQFVDLLNDATRMLMNRGSWWGTVQSLSSCIYNACIVWPRYVGTVLAVNTCNRSMPMWNHWYNFMPLEMEAVNRWLSCGRGTVGIVEDGTSSIFQQIRCGETHYIRAYIERTADVGKTITIFGIDSNGQEVRTTWADGIYREGEVLTLAKPYISTSRQYQQVTRVVKEATDGPVRLYQYDATNDLLLDMAMYDPSETNPAFIVSKIVGVNSCSCTTGCSGLKRISALVKLKHVPAVHDDDLLGIENVDAIAMMMQALNLGDQYDIKTKQAMELDAVRELNLELSQRLPIKQIPVNVMPFGTALPINHGIGAMM